MRILYIDHYAGGPSYGMEFRPFYFSKEWVKAGHNVTIVGASFSHVRNRQPTTDGLYTREWIDGVEHVWCQTRPYSGNGLGRVVNIFEFLRRLSPVHHWLTTPPDVVIASSTYPLDIYPARRIARRHDSKLIWEVHDLWPLSPIELGGFSRWHPFMMLLQRSEDDACRSADAIVSIVPKAHDHLLARGMRSDKFTHIPNGIDPVEWDPSRIEELAAPLAARLTQERQNGRFLVCYAGTHGLANALDSFIEAAACSREENVRFVLVGSGPEKQSLEQRVKLSGMQNVLFADPIPKAQIPSLLSKMDVLYLGLKRQPIFRFGVSPNKLIDYMMAGKPVICAIEAGNDMVADAKCGISIGAENPDAINNAIKQLLSMNPDQRNRMGAAGRVYAVAHHTYPVLARRFLSVIENLGPGRRTSVARAEKLASS